MSTDGNETTGTATDARHATSISKAEFIRGLPSHLSSKEVVALAKARGIIVSEAYVRQVRVAAKDRAMRATRNGGPSVADGPFVALLRSLPAQASYSEAAAKAKSAGVILSQGYFHALRGQRNSRGAVHSKPACERLLTFKGLQLASDDDER